MPRTKGISEFPANFEIQYSAPIDARMVVSTLADLTNSITWQSYDAQAYTYIGMLVSVIADPDTNNNGVYLLQGDDYTQIANWKKIGSGKEDFTTLTVYNNGKSIIPKGTLACQSSSGMYDTYITIKQMEYLTEIPLGITLTDIITNSTGTILISGLWDIGDIPGLNISRAQINDTVYVDLENYQVTTLKKYKGFEIGHITRISPLGVYFDFSGLVNEERFHKIGITETYYANFCNYSGFGAIELLHLNAALSNIYYNYTRYATILFWDIEQNGKKYTALRFNSIEDGDFKAFMRTLQNGYTTYISVYILQEKNISYTPMTSAVNTYFSRLKTRGAYTSKQIRDMAHSFNTMYPLNINFAKDTAQSIVTNFNVTGIDLGYRDTYSIFHFVNTGIKNYYTMYPTNVTGIEIYNSDMPNINRKVYDSISHTIETLRLLPNIHMVIKASKLFAVDIKNRNTNIYCLGEHLPNTYRFDKSIIRVYHLVDNLTNPRYHSFYIKPYGVDNIMLDYKKELLQKIIITNDYPVIALLKNKTKKKYTLTAIDCPITLDENHKTIARFDIEDICTSNELKKLLSVRNSNKNSEGRIKFYCKYVNGVLTPPLCEVNFVTKRTGLSHVLLPV